MTLFNTHGQRADPPFQMFRLESSRPFRPLGPSAHWAQLKLALRLLSKHFSFWGKSVIDGHVVLNALLDVLMVMITMISHRFLYPSSTIIKCVWSGFNGGRDPLRISMLGLYLKIIVFRIILTIIVELLFSKLGFYLTLRNSPFFVLTSDAAAWVYLTIDKSN